MDSKQSKTLTTINSFKRMWMDSLLSLQDSTTYREAWNAVNSTDKESGFGLSNEPANELFISLDGEVRGAIFVEERNSYVIFLLKKDGGKEIGILDADKQKYTTITNPEVTEKLGICANEFIDAEVKVMQPCNHLFLYWSSNNVYKRLDLDDECCDFSDIELIKPITIGEIKTEVVDSGGSIPNGKYFFFARARDTYGNVSNWSKIENGVSIADGDNTPGERSQKAINIRITGLNNRDYHIIDLGVISIIDNNTSIEQFTSVSTSDTDTSINYLYTGKTGREVSLKLSDVIGRVNRYIRGKNLTQFQDRLILYNLLPEYNLDYQRQANEIVVKYDNYILPLEHADKFNGLRPGEAYGFAIRWKYIDGTFSRDFFISGRKSSKKPCDDFVDDSERIKLYAEEYSKIDFGYEKEFVVGESNQKEDDLLDDEGYGIDLKPTDEPEISNYKDGNISELDHLGFEMTSNLDCLCEEVIKLLNSCGKNPIGGACSSWDLDDDVIGAVVLNELKCMCENREYNGSFKKDSIFTETEAIAMLNELKKADSKVGSCSGSSSGCGSGSSTDFVGSKSSFDDTVSGRKLERSVDYIKKRVASHVDGMIKDREFFKDKYVKQGIRCNQEGYQTCVENTCYKCSGGEWHVLNNADIYDQNSSYKIIADLNNKQYNFNFEYEYGEDGCTVVGVKPRLYSEGWFGTRITAEKYPETIDCNCEYIYGDLAGENVRLHQVPTSAKEPFFLSYSSGVPNKYAQGNSEFNESYVLMIGPKFENIQPPKNPPKPVVGYVITYIERTESNKTVIGSGVAHSCFLGEIDGEMNAFAKHAVNSFERFDRAIEPAGKNTFRGGKEIDVGAYFIHGADFHLRKPVLNATHVLFEGEYFGKGFRHGMFAKGEKPDSPLLDTLNQKGTRQSINLGSFRAYGEPLLKEVKGMSIAPANSVVSKSDKFKYNLVNNFRESGVYIEIDDDLVPFKRPDMPRNLYGGLESGKADGASDRSFIGDTYTESIPIHDARAHRVTFIKKLPNQYGSLINQSYIPIGLENTVDKTEVSGLVGDSYTGPITYKRTGLISDKTNRVISKFVNPTGINFTDNWILFFFGKLLNYIFRALGIKNGGYIPINQDASDYIRVFGGLRRIDYKVSELGNSVTYPGELEEGIDNVPPPFRPPNETRSLGTDINFGDNYVPQNLKTQITTYDISDANLYYRQLGAKDNGELVYTKDLATLKGLYIDSSIPEDVPWEKGWLNRWYSLWKENAKWKLIVQAVILFVFIYGIGMYVIFKGIHSIITGLQAIGGGNFMLQTIGGILAASVGMIMVSLGIVWIKFWIKSDADNKVVESFLNLKNIRPDRKNADGSYSFNENRLRQFEDNYWRYDSTHNYPNRFETGFGMSDPYNVCRCDDKYTNKMIWSNAQIQGVQVDFWRNFSPNSEVEIPSDRGPIKKIFVLGSNIYAHTTDMLMILRQGGVGYNKTMEDVAIGYGDLFGKAYPIYGGVLEGFAGLKDPNSTIISAYTGYVFPDREGRRFYTFNGSGFPQELGPGLSHFFDENMKFKLLEYFPEFKNVDAKSSTGIGYSIGMDYKLKRLLITKKDYEPIYNDIKLADDKLNFEYKGKVISLQNPKYFRNNSFTLSYDIINKSWISFHNYTPNLYLWDRYSMYSFNEEGMWLHNIKGKFQTFYGVYYPFSVEFVINNPQENDNFRYLHTVLSTESHKWKNVDYIKSDETFNQLMAFNSKQGSGLLDFVKSEALNAIERSEERNNIIPLTNKDGVWTYDRVKDRIRDSKSLILENDTKIGPKIFINNNISDIKNNIFIDNYFVNRLIFSNFDDIKLLLKVVQTEIQYRSR